MDTPLYGLRDVTRKTGEEPFLALGSRLQPRLSDFWQWSASNLLSNSLRGHLAEYIVTLAAGGGQSGSRIEWDGHDVTLPNGKTLEVKSAAYVQAWKSPASRISFQIGESQKWQWESNRYGAAARHADAYVFCLLAERDPEKVDPMNLDQWQFFVLPTADVAKAFGKQKTVGLAGLKRVAGDHLGFSGLSERLRSL